MKKLMSEIHAERAKALLDKSIACAKIEREAAAKDTKPIAAKTAGAKPSPNGGRGRKRSWLAIAGAAIIGASVLVASTQADAHYWRHGGYGYRYDPGPAVALGILGALAGIAASQDGYGYAPPVYRYQPACWWEEQAVYYNYGQVFAGYRPCKFANDREPITVARAAL